jgi:hypothetical protein
LCFFWFFCSFILFYFVCLSACHHHVCLCTLQFIGDFLLLTIILLCMVALLPSSHLVDICCSLNELFISPVVVHHHLTIHHCLALFIVTLCFSSLPCVAYHCFVVTITALLWLSPPHYLSYQILTLLPLLTLFVVHCHVVICLTPYCGDGISSLLSMCKLLIVCAL